MVDSAQFLRDAEAQLPRLYRVAYGILRARQDAEDASQQALLKAWAARSNARPDTFVPWLMRILVNECRNIQRHRMRMVPSDTIGATATISFTPPDPDVWRAVEALPDALRIPFSLKYLAQCTEQEVAQAMGVPVSTVKNRLSKARKTLREALSDWEVAFE